MANVITSDWECDEYRSIVRECFKRFMSMSIRMQQRNVCHTHADELLLFCVNAPNFCFNSQSYANVVC